jgi:hypothetical protein
MNYLGGVLEFDLGWLMFMVLKMNRILNLPFHYLCETKMENLYNMTSLDKTHCLPHQDNIL